MADDDVIELGSSDDDTGPPTPPKRSVHPPDAMVLIPKSPLTKKGKSSTKAVGGIRIVNVESMMEPKKKSIHGSLPKLPSTIHNGIGVNPFSATVIKQCKTSNNSKPQIFISPKIHPRNTNFSVLPKVQNVSLPTMSHLSKNQQQVKCVTKQQGVKCLQRLPPGLTVKKMPQPAPKSVQRKRPMPSIPVISSKKSKLIPPGNKFDVVGAVLTVELDDDGDITEPVADTAVPSWYVRPEDVNESVELQIEANVKEEENSNECDKPVVEVEIEDSPVKTKNSNKQTNKENMFTITIEDSPVKLHNKGKCEKMSSENEKTPNSKKKLHYLDDNEANNKDEVMVEIDIPILPDVDEQVLKAPDADEQVLKTSDIDEKVLEAPDIDKQIHKTHEIDEQIHKTPEKKRNNCKKEIPENDIIDLDTPVKMLTEDFKSPNSPEPDKIMNNCDIEEVKQEFHPVYQKFIDLCLELENSDDMKQIVEKKIKNYYKKVPQSYTESDVFLELVTFKMKAMRESPQTLYFNIKDIVDELNLQRKLAKTEVTKTNEAMENVADECLDEKQLSRIKKLEKTLRKLQRAVQKLDEQEVDLDDEDSVYLISARYKKRLVEVHRKICQLRNIKMPSEPRVHIDTRPGRPEGPAKRIEAFVNKKVPIGAHLPFPDFHDVLNCVKIANKEDKLGWNEFEIMEEARDLFSRCGKKLQRRRQENEWRLASYRLPSEKDPAEINPELKSKLDTNKRLAAKKESDVFDKYVDRQIDLKLEPVEVPDKDLEQSSEGSDDDSVEEVVKDLNEVNKDELKTNEIADNIEKERDDDIQSESSKDQKNIVGDNEENKKSVKETFEILDSEDDDNCSDIETGAMSPISISDSEESNDVTSIKSLDAVLNEEECSENHSLTRGMEVEDEILIDSDSQGSSSNNAISTDYIENNSVSSDIERTSIQDPKFKSNVIKNDAKILHANDMEMEVEEGILIDSDSQGSTSNAEFSKDYIENKSMRSDSERICDLDTTSKGVIEINTEMPLVRTTSTEDPQSNDVIIKDVTDPQSKTAISKDVESDKLTLDFQETSTHDSQLMSEISKDVADNDVVMADIPNASKVHNTNANGMTEISSLTNSQTYTETKDEVSTLLQSVNVKENEEINGAMSKETSIEDDKIAEKPEDSFRNKKIQNKECDGNLTNIVTTETENLQHNNIVLKDNSDTNNKIIEDSSRTSPEGTLQTGTKDLMSQKSKDSSPTNCLELNKNENTLDSVSTNKSENVVDVKNTILEIERCLTEMAAASGTQK